MTFIIVSAISNYVLPTKQLGFDENIPGVRDADKSEFRDRLASTGAPPSRGYSSETGKREEAREV